MNQASGDRYEHLVVADAGAFRIREKHPDDAFEDYHWRRDPELARFDGLPPISMTFTQFLDQFNRDLATTSHERRGFSLDTPDGVHFGNIVFYNADLLRTSAEIGITIGRADYRERGFGTAVVIVFLRYLFGRYGFRQICLHTLEWNERAQRCFQRAGFEVVRRVERGRDPLLRMEVRRAWWSLWDEEGRFEAALARVRELATPGC